MTSSKQTENILTVTLYDALGSVNGLISTWKTSCKYNNKRPQWCSVTLNQHVSKHYAQKLCQMSILWTDLCSLYTSYLPACQVVTIGDSVFVHKLHQKVHQAFEDALLVDVPCIYLHAMRGLPKWLSLCCHVCMMSRANNNNKGDFYSTHLPHKVGTQGTLQ